MTFGHLPTQPARISAPKTRQPGKKRVDLTDEQLSTLLSALASFKHTLTVNGLAARQQHQLDISVELAHLFQRRLTRHG